MTTRPSWTQPLCDPCWADDYGIVNDDGDVVGLSRLPVRLVDPDPQTCCRCGRSTSGGIYVRVDPKTVSFPRVETDE